VCTVPNLHISLPLYPPQVEREYLQLFFCARRSLYRGCSEPCSQSGVLLRRRKVPLPRRKRPELKKLRPLRRNRRREREEGVEGKGENGIYWFHFSSWFTVFVVGFLRNCIKTAHQIPLMNATEIEDNSTR